MFRNKVLVLIIALMLGVAGVAHAQDVPTDVPTDTSPVVEVTAQPTSDTVEVPVPGDKEDNSGTVIVTYDAFSNIFKIILAIVVTGGVFSLGTIALVIRQVRQDKDVVEAGRLIREKQSPIVNDAVDGLTSLLTEVALLLKATRDPNAPPLPDDPSNPLG